MSMISPTKFYHVTEIILQILSYEQSFTPLTFHTLALVLTLKFYDSVAERLKLKVKNNFG